MSGEERLLIWFGMMVLGGVAYAVGERLVRKTAEWLEAKENEEAQCPGCGGSGRIPRSKIKESLSKP